MVHPDRTYSVGHEGLVTPKVIANVLLAMAAYLSRMEDEAAARQAQAQAQMLARMPMGGPGQ